MTALLPVRVAADQAVYLTLHGFTESLNLSVAAAMVMQQLFFLRPDLRADMSDDERAAIRRQWYLQLAKTPQQHEEYPMWLAPPLPAPFTDLRRPAPLRAGDQRVPPKIKKRLSALEQQQSKQHTVPTVANAAS
eukprot:SAG22_NODE_1599_length_4030_cov_39.665225_2_plen_134_part_00